MLTKHLFKNARPVRGRRVCIQWGLVLSLWFSLLVMLAQQERLSGRFVDSQHRALVGVPITLMAPKDTTQKYYALTDTNGVFRFTGLSRQAYVLRATYLGFRNFLQEVVIQQADQEVGDLVFQDQSRLLQSVTVVGQAASVRQKGDTMQFNAYKVNRDATVEDLVRKLPGLTLENGLLKAQGQTVQQVLVDGKPFFWDDPAIALRNLPASLIDKVEVFDQLSEQARFSGIRDGNTTKTVNIVTRADQQESLFGRFYAGKGTASTYLASGNLNLFRGKQRLSILGLTNTINQQNFSTQYMLGVSSGGPPKLPDPPKPGGPPPGQPGSSGTFQVGQQPGISQTKSIGVNFSDTWAKRITVQGSYFLNNTVNHNQQSDYRYYFLPGQTSQIYQATTMSQSQAANHRLEARLDYQIDSRNRLMLNDRFSNQTNQSASDVNGQATLSDQTQPTRQTNQYQLQGGGYTVNNTLLLRHRFRKAGRTISADLGTSILMREITRFQRAQIDQVAPKGLPSSSQQRSGQRTPTRQVSLNTVYTEPLTSVSQLHLTYNRTYQYGNSIADTRFIDPATNTYGPADGLLSNTFTSDYRTSRAMLGYHLHTQTVGFVVDMAYQWATLTGKQTFPASSFIQKSFGDWLPAAHLEYKPNSANQWHIEYRTLMQAPSINQLQPVIDNTKPLLIQTGNPTLKPSYGHTVKARYTYTSGLRSFLILLDGNRTQQYIGTLTRINEDTTQSGNDSWVVKGGQLVKPVNLAGYYTINTPLTYSQLIQAVKTNLSEQTGYTHSRIPSLLSNQLNNQYESGLSQRITLSSNVSHAIDFYTSYSLVFNHIRNTIQQISSNRYIYQTAEARLSWEFGTGFMLQTDMTNQRYQSFSGQQNRQYTLWNVAASRKFLKGRQAELKVSVVDLLRQNSTISQTLTDTYFQTTQSQVLQRYFLLTFTYTLHPAPTKQP